MTRDWGSPLRLRVYSGDDVEPEGMSPLRNALNMKENCAIAQVVERLPAVLLGEDFWSNYLSIANGNQKIIRLNSDHYLPLI